MKIAGEGSVVFEKKVSVGKLAVNNATVTNENFNAALGGNDRPVVVVSISVGDTLIENFTQTTARRA